MPVEHWVESDRRRVRIVVTGRLTTDEILSAVDEILGDEALEPGFALLSDHTGVEEPITTEQLHGMLGHMGRFSEILAGTHWAIVVSAPASYGMMRMFSVLAQRVSLVVEVFRSLSEAEQWLDRHTIASGAGVEDDGGEPAD